MVEDADFKNGEKAGHMIGIFIESKSFSGFKRGDPGMYEALRR